MDRCKSSSGFVWLSSGRSPVSGISNTYVNLVSGFCRFSPFLRFRETWTPGKGIYTTISKGSSQGLTYLGLTLQAGFLQNGHGFPSCHVSEFFTVFSVFFWFSGLRNRWKPNCLITDGTRRPWMCESKTSPGRLILDLSKLGLNTINHPILTYFHSRYGCGVVHVDTRKREGGWRKMRR